MIELERRLGALKSALLEALHHLPDEPTDKEISALNRRWKHLRGEIDRVGNELAHAGGEVGDAVKFRATIFATPQWQRFAKLRTARWRRLPGYTKPNGEEVPSYLEKQKDYARSRRADPDENEKINARRRAKYARK